MQVTKRRVPTLYRLEPSHHWVTIASCPFLETQPMKRRTLTCLQEQIYSIARHMWGWNVIRDLTHGHWSLSNLHPLSKPSQWIIAWRRSFLFQGELFARCAATMSEREKKDHCLMKITKISNEGPKSPSKVKTKGFIDIIWPGLPKDSHLIPESRHLRKIAYISSEATISKSTSGDVHKDYEEQVTYLARSGIADIESFDRDRPVPVTSVHSTCNHQTLDLVQKSGRWCWPKDPAPILGPMKMSSMGISQSSMVSFLSLFCLTSFLLLSSAELARARGLTLVGLELSDLLLPWVGDVAGETWSAIRTWTRR